MRELIEMTAKYRILMNLKSIKDPIIGIAFRRYDGNNDDKVFTTFLYGRMEVYHYIDKDIENLEAGDVIEMFNFPKEVSWGNVKEINLPTPGKNIYDIFFEEVKLWENSKSEQRKTA